MARSLLLLASILLALPARAKDLRNRVGLGFNQQVGASPAGGVSSLSVRYGLPTAQPVLNVQVEGELGFSGGSGGSGDLYTGGRVLWGVVAEDNLNLYLAAGGGLLRAGGADYVRVEPGIAVDFFLFGLENLGFTTGWGLDLDLGGTTTVATTASAVVGAHYWF